MESNCMGCTWRLVLMNVAALCAVYVLPPHHVALPPPILTLSRPCAGNAGFSDHGSPAQSAEPPVVSCQSAAAASLSIARTEAAVSGQARSAAAAAGGCLYPAAAGETAGADVSVRLSLAWTLHCDRRREAAMPISQLAGWQQAFQPSQKLSKRLDGSVCDQCQHAGRFRCVDCSGPRSELSTIAGRLPVRCVVQVTGLTKMCSRYTFKVADMMSSWLQERQMAAQQSQKAGRGEAGGLAGPGGQPEQRGKL